MCGVVKEGGKHGKATVISDDFCIAVCKSTCFHQRSELQPLLLSGRQRGAYNLVLEEVISLSLNGLPAIRTPRALLFTTDPDLSGQAQLTKPV